jgi:type IV secretory pathway VirB10-like protein
MIGSKHEPFVNKSIQVSVATCIGLPMLATAAIIWFWGASTHTMPPDYEQVSSTGRVNYRTSPPSVAKQEVKPNADPTPAPVEKTPTPIRIASQTQVREASHQQQDRSEPSPQQPTIQGSYGNSARDEKGERVPGYRFVSVENAILAATELGGQFAVKVFGSESEFLVGSSLDPVRAVARPSSKTDAAKYSERKVLLDSSYQSVQQLRDGVAAQLGIPPEALGVYVVFPNHVDAAIVDAQRRALAESRSSETRQLMTVRYLGQLWSSKFRASLSARREDSSIRGTEE